MTSAIAERRRRRVAAPERPASTTNRRRCRSPLESDIEATAEENLKIRKARTKPRKTPKKENFSENISQQGATKNEKSVKWAQKTALDSKGQVLGFWSRPLQNMAESSSYRSLQIQTSLSYFEKAQQYFQAFEFTQLRHLLLMYDFVIQNGSIGENHLKIYECQESFE